jgi:hypothetical protein
MHFLACTAQLQLSARFTVPNKLSQNVKPTSRPVSQFVTHGRSQDGLDPLDLLLRLVGSAAAPRPDLLDVLDLPFGAILAGSSSSSRTCGSSPLPCEDDGARQRGDRPSHDGQYLHLKDEGIAALDLGGGPVISVPQLARDVQFPLVPRHHELHRLRPSLDDLIGSERGRAAPVVARIEDRPVEEPTLVVARAGRIDGGVIGTLPLLEDFVLEAGGQGDDARLVCILSQKGHSGLVGPRDDDDGGGEGG